MSGFVYIWRDRKKNRFYIGSHWGSEDDGYICSSQWMRRSYNNRPQDFKRRILSRISSSRKDLLEKEIQWLKLIKEDEKGKRYYNLQIKAAHWTSDPNKLLTIGQKISASQKANPNWGSWSKGRKFSKETLKKMSLAKKGKTSAFKGKKHSEESKRKNSESNKGRIAWNVGIAHSSETRKKISVAHTGKIRIFSEQHKQNLSKSLKGRVHSEETKRKISNSLRKI